MNVDLPTTPFDRFANLVINETYGLQTPDDVKSGHSDLVCCSDDIHCRWLRTQSPSHAGQTIQRMAAGRRWAGQHSLFQAEANQPRQPSDAESRVDVR